MTDQKSGTKRRRPLENFFNLPEEVQVEEESSKELQPIETVIKPTESYDEKDNEIEGMYDKIHRDATYTHERILDEIEDVEQNKKARFYEVAANYLNLALSAVQDRARMKEHKDKLTTKVNQSGSKTTNQTLVINTTDLIKQLQAEVIEGEAIEISNDTGKTNE